MAERVFTRAEVAAHSREADGWIVLEGVVYDITDHIAALRKQQRNNATQLVATIAHLGSDATAEFAVIHRWIPEARQQLPRYRVGRLAPGQ